MDEMKVAASNTPETLAASPPQLANGLGLYFSSESARLPACYARSAQKFPATRCM